MTRTPAWGSRLLASLVAAMVMTWQLPLDAAVDEIDPRKARSFGDAVGALLLADKAADIWQKVEARFRREVPEAQVRSTLDQMYAQYGGKLLEVDNRGSWAR